MTKPILKNRLILASANLLSVRLIPRNFAEFVAIISACIFLAGCSTTSYRTTLAGEFDGKLDVRWVETDYFIFIPNKEDPLTLIRSDGSRIVPKVMYTDGGSIPKMFWGINGLSPWGYAPAYMIHDWMFVAKHCNHEPDIDFTFEDSVTVMAEALKAIMESDSKAKNYFVFDAIVQAVATPIAKRLWDDGKCVEAPESVAAFTAGAAGQNPPGEFLFSISFEE